MRFFVEFSYKGSNYHGWQKQPHVITVQQELDKALTIILNNKIETVGAGRTDSGVHAKQMFAHFDVQFSFDVQDIINKLNRFLPKDIVVHTIFRVNDNASSRFDAISRTYQYHVVHQKNPFNEDAYLLYNKLDIDLMNIACVYILGKQDFTSFSKSNTQTFTNNCDVISASWEIVNNELIFTIKADRFLRNMVRAIVGTLLEVGLGKIKPIAIKDIIEKKNRSEAGTSVPAHALFLTVVEYPKDIIG
tara:strand:+ start:5300 stop:6040 length:741 start_codon:yes stop_codon:yes gene_type:complete